MRGIGRATWLMGIVWVFGGACGSSGEPAPSYTPVSATSDGSVYTLTLGDLKMVIDGAKGARITEFSLDGTNVLTGRDLSTTNYGSTYWPSPQSSWCAAGGGCWPPPAAIDNLPYNGLIDDATQSIQLGSGEAALEQFPGASVVVTKTFTPVPESGAIDVEYRLINATPLPYVRADVPQPVSVSVAPWQISRVATGGLTFFGEGTGSVSYAADSDPAFTITASGGTQWYPFAPVSRYSKAFADSSGWLAHVTPDRLLYLQSYPDIQPADAAPGEAEVEIFTNGDYVEIEPQGALATLFEGQSLTWTIRWQLRRVPDGTTVAPDSASLAAFANETLAE
jgi:hypothetical protein